MMVSKAARRYAKALLQSALEKNKLGEIEKDIRFIQNTLDDSRELKVFLRSPVITTENKLKGLNSIFGKKVSDETKSLFRLLSEKRRESLLAEICTGFIQLYNDHQGLIQVEVETAYPMSDSQKKELQKELSEKTGKKVQMNVVENKELIGGLVIKIGDTVIDGSVKHKINKLKKQFAVGTAV